MLPNDKKLKVLIMTRAALDRSNSAGSTFGNFFDGMQNVELSNIYLSYGEPKNGLRMRYFQITEKSLIANLLKGTPSGREVQPGEDDISEMNETETKGFDLARKIRLTPFFWAREFIWRIGRVHSKQLREFVQSVDPDVIMLSMGDYCFINRECRKISDEFSLPVCAFIGDDIYSLRRVSFSPLFWIDRLAKRASHRKLIKRCSKVFVMTDRSKEEFERSLGRECTVLTKSLDFTGEPDIAEDAGSPMRFIYTGNLYAGRWKSLAALGRALQRVNGEGGSTELVIYSATPMTRAMQKAFDIPSVKFMGGVPGSEIPAIQSGADVLVHAESMQKKNMLIVRLSFSTKLVDYMHVPKCILAIGSEELASIDHLIRHDAAVVVSDEAHMYDAVKKLSSDPALVREYAAKAWRCGAEHHNKKDVQARLYSALKAAAEGAGENK